KTRPPAPRRPAQEPRKQLGAIKTPLPQIRRPAIGLPFARAIAGPAMAIRALRLVEVKTAGIRIIFLSLRRYRRKRNHHRYRHPQRRPEFSINHSPHRRL